MTSYLLELLVFWLVLVSLVWNDAFIFIKCRKPDLQVFRSSNYLNERYARAEIEHFDCVRMKSDLLPDERRAGIKSA